MLVKWSNLIYTPTSKNLTQVSSLNIKNVITNMLYYRIYRCCNKNAMMVNMLKLKWESDDGDVYENIYWFSHMLLLRIRCRS